MSAPAAAPRKHQDAFRVANRAARHAQSAGPSVPPEENLPVGNTAMEEAFYGGVMRAMRNTAHAPARGGE